MPADRLRRLDALFAEKVLGWELAGAITVLPTYTRSLDAAWEGAMKLTDSPPGGFIPESIFNVRVGSHATPFVPALNPEYKATVNRPQQGGLRYWTGEASHPAEALVLACLRAVGVSEEEMK